MKTVTIVQELLPQYRVELFDQLRDQLAERDVELRLLHGRTRGTRATRGDAARLDWAETVQNKEARLPGGMLLTWQPAVRAALHSDLVIVEQANRHLLNYLLLATRRAGRGPLVAFWGHGANLQAGNRNSFAERWKARLAAAPDWFFAYTEGSADRVQRSGFSRDRITVVQNAINVTAYTTRPAPFRSPRHCVFLGSLYDLKRVDFLLEAAEHAHALDGAFRLHVIGDGEERRAVESFAADRPWVTFDGPLFGAAKAAVVRSSSLMLMPGLVGLAVLDAFAAETPVVTTDIPWHSPEFEYLEHGVNSLVLPATSSARQFGHAVVELLHDDKQLDDLRTGCRDSAQTVTIEAMAHRFAAGILAALDAGRRRGETRQRPRMSERTYGHTK